MNSPGARLFSFRPTRGYPMNRPIRLICHVIAAAAAVGSASALAQPPSKQPAKPAEAAPFKAGTVLVVEHASLDKLFADPKDKAFGDALAMIPDRIRELP